jgi:integrase
VQRTINRLTARQVNNAKPPKGRDAMLLADGGNLYLQCTIGRDGHVRRSWLFRYEQGGRRREMGLGSLDTNGLSEARERARACRQLLLDKIDPIEHRRKVIENRAVQAAKNKTFGEVATAYLKAHAHEWKNPKHAWQWEQSLTKEVKAITSLPVNAIDTSHILQVLEPIWCEKPETASRIRGRIERVLAYATAAQYRTRESGNPARWDGHLEELLGSKVLAQRAKRTRTGKSGHHPALPYADLPQLMTMLRRLDSLSARALEFTVLMAARTSETIGADWSEIDLEAKTWTVPGTRMKAGKEHKVPLSGRAVHILEQLSGSRTGRVFPPSNMAMLQCLRGLRPGLTTHGFRSTFMDWAHERTAFPKVVIDMALAHQVGDKVEAAYRRGDLFEKRRQLMHAWCGYCTTHAPADTVTPMRRVANA